MTSDYKLNNQFLEDILERNYFSHFQKHEKELSLIFSDGSIVLGNKCAFFSSFDKYMSPKEENLLSILNWYNRSNFNCNINIIGNDKEYFDFYYNYLTIILNFFKEKENRPLLITINSLCDFLNNPLQKSLVEKMINDFYKISIRLVIIPNIYEISLNKKTQVFFGQIINFIDKHDYTDIKFIISEENIKNALQLYMLLITTLKDNSRLKDVIIEEIENRNFIQYRNEYLSFYDFYLNALYELAFDKNDNTFVDYLLLNRKAAVIPFYTSFFEYKDYIKCGIRDELFVDITKMTVPLCPGLNNKYYTIGEISFIDNKIHFLEKNVSAQIIKDHLKHSCMPNCECCLNACNCRGFCLKSSFDDHGNILVPIPDMCLLKQDALMQTLSVLSNLGKCKENFLKKMEPNKNYYDYYISLFEKINKQRGEK